MHSELCRIAEVKPLINNVELFGIPLGINMLRHVIPIQSRRLVRESLGGGMGHWGGLRYIYMHSASGGLFQYLLTTFPEYPMYKPPFNPRILC